MKFEFDTIEIAKILSKFNDRNIKLTFDNLSDINNVFNEIFPVFLQANGRFQKNNYNSKGHELSCNKMKVTGKVLFYQYANVVSLADPNHFQNIQNLHNFLTYFCYFKRMPIIDMNGLFGVDLSSDEKYLNGYYYSVVPYALNQLLPEQQQQSLKDMKLEEIWHDYVLSFSSANNLIYLSYIGFDSRKFISKLGYSTLIKDFIQKPATKHKKIDNLIDFLKKEKQLYNEEFEECGLQFPSISSTAFNKEHFGVELVPCPYENKKDRNLYLDVLDEYFSKLIDYKLLTTAQKDFILYHDSTVKNKDGVLKFRWNDLQTYDVKWYNLERRVQRGA